MSTATKWASIATKKRRIRKKVVGSAERPRLSVYRSECHIYGQIIDDVAGRTLASASTRDQGLREQVKDLKPLDAAKKVGEALAAAAQKAGLTAVCFDRGGRTYAGRIKALADAARANGLQF